MDRGNSAVRDHAPRVHPDLFVNIFKCKRGAKYERLFPLSMKPKLSYSVHTSRSHFTANSGYKETPATPSETNSGL